MNKKEREQLVVTLHREGKTIRQIAQQVHMGFKDISAIIRRIDGTDDNDDPHLSNKSKSTQVLYLFEHGKKPIDVAIQSDLPYSDVEELQQEYWALKELYDLACMFMEIKYDLTPFVKLSKLLKKNRMLDEKQISKLIKYAGHELPSLESKFQTLSNDVIDLQWKKKDCQNPP